MDDSVLLTSPNRAQAASTMLTMFHSGVGGRESTDGSHGEEEGCDGVPHNLAVGLVGGSGGGELLGSPSVVFDDDEEEDEDEHKPLVLLKQATLRPPTWRNDDDSDSDGDDTAPTRSTRQRSMRASSNGKSSGLGGYGGIAVGVNMLSSAFGVADGGHTNERSLGALCENFLAEYGNGGNGEVSLDAAAASLSVERRRIYDITNIFESLDIVKRKAKNKYEWLGTQQLWKTLQVLKQKAIDAQWERVKRCGPCPRDVSSIPVASPDAPYVNPVTNAVVLVSLTSPSTTGTSTTTLTTSTHVASGVGHTTQVTAMPTTVTGLGHDGTGNASPGRLQLSSPHSVVPTPSSCSTVPTPLPTPSSSTLTLSQSQSQSQSLSLSLSQSQSLCTPTLVPHPHGVGGSVPLVLPGLSLSGLMPGGHMVDPMSGPLRQRRSPFRVGKTVSSTPIRATAAEIRRMKECGESIDSPSRALTSPKREFVFGSSADGVCNANWTDRACPDTDVIVADDLLTLCAGRIAAMPRREKSLGALCQKFISIYLLGRRCVCLDEAARVLMRPEELAGAAKLRTKVRRLYDIANVLCTLGLLEKVMVCSQKKPGFLWKGPEFVPDPGTYRRAPAPPPQASKKRPRPDGASKLPPSKAS